MDRTSGCPCLAPLGHCTKPDNRPRRCKVVIVNYVADLGGFGKIVGLCRLQRAVVATLEMPTDEHVWHAIGDAFDCADHTYVLGIICCVASDTATRSASAHIDALDTVETNH